MSQQEAIREQIIQIVDGLSDAEQHSTLEFLRWLTAPEPESFNEPAPPDGVAEALTFTPRLSTEIVGAGLIGGWEHKGITDSVAFVMAQRARRKARRIRRINE